MKTFRLTVKRLPMTPVPFGYPMHGVPQNQKYVYRIRRDGEVIGSGVTSYPDHPDAMLAKKTAA